MVSPAVVPAPAVADIYRVAAIPRPVLRNLHITQSYYELSTALAQRLPGGANWCTFATWASKQAGQTIRKEDLQRSLLGVLREQPGIEAALTLVAAAAQGLGAGKSMEQLKQTTLAAAIGTVVDRSSEAVSRGNKKVFEEIGLHFAQFLWGCYNDETYREANINAFCAGLKPGAPPEGQQYLRQAFTAYYTALFEPDEKQRCELQLLANLLVGLHEQTRLQPEIAQSLNAAMVDTAGLKNKLLMVLAPESYWLQARNWLQRLLGKDLLGDAVERLLLHLQRHLRRLLTLHLMTLYIPPGPPLRLAVDLKDAYPAHLARVLHPPLQKLLQQIDPTTNSLQQSGATDWALLPERMHYIAELFRCYHQSQKMFQNPFTEEQTAAIKNGVVPAGPL